MLLEGALQPAQTFGYALHLRSPDLLLKICTETFQTLKGYGDAHIDAACKPVVSIHIRIGIPKGILTRSVATDDSGFNKMMHLYSRN